MKRFLFLFEIEVKCFDFTKRVLVTGVWAGRGKWAGAALRGAIWACTLWRLGTAARGTLHFRCGHGLSRRSGPVSPLPGSPVKNPGRMPGTTRQRCAISSAMVNPLRTARPVNDEHSRDRHVLAAAVQLLLGHVSVQTTEPPSAASSGFAEQSNGRIGIAP